MKLIFMFILSMITLQALADTKLGIMGSFLYNVADGTGLENYDGVDEKSEVGFGAGLRAIMGIQDQLYFRSGAGIVQKNVSFDVTSGPIDGNVKYTYTYLNIPLTLYWRASPQVGFFGGTSLNSLLSDDCKASGGISSCRDQKTRTIVLPAVLGFDFNLTDKLGIELSYEYGIMETAKDIKVSSAVASVIYQF